MNNNNVFKVLLLFFCLAAAGCSGTSGINGPESSRTVQGQPGFKHSSCYQAGYQWGVCAAKETAGQKCRAGADATVPEVCKDKPETQQGIKDGIRSVQMRYHKMQ